MSVQFFKQLKLNVESVDNLYKIGSALFIAVAAFASIFIRSHTLAIIIAATATIAGVVSFLCASWRYATVPPDQNKRLFRRHITLAAIGFAGTIIAISIADPGVAELGRLLSIMREVLMTTMLIFNVVVGLGSFVFVYNSVAAIIVASPRRQTGP